MGNARGEAGALENEVRRYLEWRRTPVDQRPSGYFEIGFEILEAIWANLDELRRRKQGLKLDFESPEEVGDFLNQAYWGSTHAEVELKPQDIVERLRSPLRYWRYTLKMQAFAAFRKQFQPSTLIVRSLSPRSDERESASEERAAPSAERQPQTAKMAAGTMLDIWLKTGGTTFVDDQRKPLEIPIAVRGGVEAATSGGALLAIEREIDALLGACEVLGIGHFIPDNNSVTLRGSLHGAAHDEWKASLRTVVVEGNEYRLPAVFEDRLSAFRFAPSRRDPRIRAILRDDDAPDTAPFASPHERRRSFQYLANVMCGVSERARAIRTACRLATLALEAQELAVGAVLACTAFEALLLKPHDQDDVTSRLREALAHSTATNHAEVEEYRKAVNELYEIRSAFVHRGATHTFGKDKVRATESLFRRRKLRGLLCDVLYVQIQRLDEKGRLIEVKRSHNKK